MWKARESELAADRNADMRKHSPIVRCVLCVCLTRSCTCVVRQHMPSVVGARIGLRYQV